MLRKQISLSMRTWQSWKMTFSAFCQQSLIWMSLAVSWTCSTFTRSNPCQKHSTRCSCNGRNYKASLHGGWTLHLAVPAKRNHYAYYDVSRPVRVHATYATTTRTNERIETTRKSECNTSSSKLFTQDSSGSGSPPNQTRSPFCQLCGVSSIFTLLFICLACSCRAKYSDPKAAVANRCSKHSAMLLRHVHVM